MTLKRKQKTQDTKNNKKSKSFHYAPSPSYYMKHVLQQAPWYLTRLYVRHPPTSPHSMCCARLPGLLSPITNQGLNCTLEWVARAGIVLVKVQHISIPSGAPIFWRCLWQRNAKWYEKSPGYPLGNRNGLYYFFLTVQFLQPTLLHIHIHTSPQLFTSVVRILQNTSDTLLKKQKREMETVQW